MPIHVLGPAAPPFCILGLTFTMPIHILGLPVALLLRIPGLALTILVHVLGPAVALLLSIPGLTLAMLVHVLGPAAIPLFRILGLCLPANVEHIPLSLLLPVIYLLLRLIQPLPTLVCLWPTLIQPMDNGGGLTVTKLFCALRVL